MSKEVTINAAKIEYDSYGDYNVLCPECKNEVPYIKGGCYCVHCGVKLMESENMIINSDLRDCTICKHSSSRYNDDAGYYQDFCKLKNRFVVDGEEIGCADYVETPAHELVDLEED